MGNDISCPCTGKTHEDLATPNPDNNKNNQYESINFKAKLESDDILYHYSYGLTKINLIRTCNLEAFFNSRHLLKVNKKKEVKINLKKNNFFLFLGL